MGDMGREPRVVCLHQGAGLRGETRPVPDMLLDWRRRFAGDSGTEYESDCDSDASQETVCRDTFADVR